MPERLSIRNAVVLVTGAGQGIGYALCSAALARGAFVVALDLEVAGLETLAGTPAGKRLRVHRVDVLDSAAVNAAVAATLDEFDRLDIAVANAGIERIAPVQSMSPDDFEAVINVNVLGVYRTIQPCLAPVIESGGHVVAVSSLAALLPFPYGAAYAASKAAVDMLMRILRFELLDSGATAGAAYFGFVLSDMGQRVTSHPGVESLSRRLPTHLIGMAPHLPVEEVATTFLNGIERRRARIYAPWSVRVPHVLRGVLVPLDDFLGRHVMRLPELTRRLFGHEQEPPAG